MRRRGPEGFFVPGDGEGFQLEDFVVGRRLEQGELPVVGQEQLALLFDVIPDLLRVQDVVEAFAGRFHLDGAACRFLAVKRLGLVAVLQLVGREEAAVGDARAAVFGMNDAADLRLEGVADVVEQVGERGVTGSLAGRAVERGNVSQVFLKGMHGGRLARMGGRAAPCPARRAAWVVVLAA